MNFSTGGQHFDLAVQHHQAGRWSEAERIYREILADHPDHAGAMHLLGMVLYQRGERAEAYPLVRRGAELDAGNGAYQANLGAVCRSLHRTEEAAEAYRRSVEMSPNVAVVWNNLGNLQADTEQLDLALSSYRKALEIDPKHPNTRMNLAKTLAEAGRFSEAFAEYHLALAQQPSAKEHSNLLLDLHYPDEPSIEEIFEEHLRFDRIYAKPLKPLTPGHHLDRSPDRPLRVGYISPDFRQHPVAHLLEPLLANHDRAEFRIHCYSDAPPHEVLHRLRGYADRWTDTRLLSDEELSKALMQDQIDILVDLAGHTYGNRLLVFARRPAPVQITCIGYPDTTGLSEIDYRFTDAQRSPPENKDAFSSEKLYRLPRSAWCYRPFEISLPAGAAPALRNGYVTFGCLNTHRKITPNTLRIWGQILSRLPTARLILSVGSIDRSAKFGRKLLIAYFAAAGIDESRVQLIDRCSNDQYLSHLAQIDIALDTFPYQGGLTTLDTLWMGTPVVVLAGRSYVSRVGVNILSQVGLGDLIADTPQDYVRIALDLAENIPRLTKLHETLRNLLERSPLMDEKGYTHHVEAAMRQMWRNYCGKTSG
jgi:predicted O-linked N-acetylglucosamine transferase (SPINDLY family)